MSAVMAVDHDPGPAGAAARVGELETVAAEPIRLGGDSRILVGTASWTDPTMTAAGVFYPASATTAEERLQHYASTFPLVEVDATYYALPSARTAELYIRPFVWSTAARMRSGKTVSVSTRSAAFVAW